MRLKCFSLSLQALSSSCVFIHYNQTVPIDHYIDIQSDSPNTEEEGKEEASKNLIGDERQRRGRVARKRERRQRRLTEENQGDCMNVFYE